MESSYAFAKLADVDPSCTRHMFMHSSVIRMLMSALAACQDPRDCYLPQNVTEEPFNFSATIVCLGRDIIAVLLAEETHEICTDVHCRQALEAFDLPPAPTLSVAWSACCLASQEEIMLN